MTRSIYYLFTTVAFGLIAVSTIISIILHQPILDGIINIGWLKMLLIIWVSMVEAGFILRLAPRILGWVLAALLPLGFPLVVMHWVGASTVVLLLGAPLLLVLVVMAVIERNKGPFNYALMLFLAVRFLILSFDMSGFLWWTDLVVCILVFLLGIERVWKAGLDTA